MKMEVIKNSEELNMLMEPDNISPDSVQLSEEQELFIHKALKGHNILVDACIGSGKTTAIQRLCDVLPKNKNILYLTYNKLLKLDAKSKIKNDNVTVNNYHGFAFNTLKKAGITAGVSDLIQYFVKEKPLLPQYDVLIIDEYQDIDEELADLLEYIKSTNPSIQIIVVGDMAQKIYDKTALNVAKFIKQFIGKHIKLEFTCCFRLSADIAAKLGRIWHKTIVGVNNDCVVENMSIQQAVDFLVKQEPKNILCLGSRTGKMADTLNLLETSYADTFNKKTVWASIRDNGATGSTEPKKDSAIFTTYDGCKGLERKYCFVFDFTENYWYFRATSSQQAYEILRNIFCVAASRGKERIIFVSNGEKLLSEQILSTEFDNQKLHKDVNISEMFDFKYKENIEKCFLLLNRTRVSTADNEVIEIKARDELIDLSPCIGIYQEAVFFNGDNYNIDREIELYSASRFGKNIYSDEIRQSSLDKKILYLTFLQTRQYRYMRQVETPFVSDSEKEQIIKRLSTVFTPDEKVQVRCQIPFTYEENGYASFVANGYADVVKNNIVYELKFVSELSHEHFLQCACYMVALKLQKGILWNVRDNTRFEITIPDVDRFLDAVAKTISKNSLSRYYKPVTDNIEEKSYKSNFAVIDTETNWKDKVMSIGIIIAEPNEYKVIDTRYYIIHPECIVGGMFSNALEANDISNKRYSREEAISDIRSCFKTFGVSKIFAYNAAFDYRHLPELSGYVWYDIMRIAAYKQYNSKIPLNAECFGNGKLKRNYGVEAIMRMLSEDLHYNEKHNALCDAADELKIMQLLGHKLEMYDCAALKSKTSKRAKNAYTNSFSAKTDRTSFKCADPFSGFSQSDCCSAADAARILGVSKNTVYNLIHKGLLAAFKKGNKYIIKKSDIYAYIEWKQQQQRKATVTAFAYAAASVFLFLLLFILFLGQ